MWKMNPLRDAQLVSVSDFPIATYSGMLPGVISGQYNRSAMEIDLVRLSQAAGARLIIGNVVGLDHQRRELIFSDRPPLGFDVLSIGIGSRPNRQGVSISDDAPLIAVKPMQTFLDRLLAMLRATGKTTPTIAIVGGGVGSIEIAFCLRERFFGKPKYHEEVHLGELKPNIKIVTGGSAIGNGLLESTIQKTAKLLTDRNIEIVTDARVCEVFRDHLQMEDGRSIAFDIVIWATGAIGAPLLGQLGLENDDRGFLLTRPNLETTKLDRIFAVGDTGTIIGSQISKAGVYAVRQGPVLIRNIQRIVSGSGQLEDYHPQTDFLKLINLGNDQAIMEFKGHTFAGRWCWKLKNHIDVKFIRKYQNYDPMPMKPSAGDDLPPMKCLGCGGKIGSQLLSQVLAELDVPQNNDVKIGLQHPDDAAIVRTYNDEVTVTTDFFAAPFDDPYLVGRIATLNSASDCFVMGAQPTAALAIVQLPQGHPKAQLQIMRELMAGSVQELNKMGAAIVGGHSIEGPRTMIGFTVLGRQLSEPKTKGMLAVGDQLVMTKPLGTGILLAAWMQSQLPAGCYGPLIETMLMSNEIALKLIQDFPITAITDVTGFGFAGHLAEMLEASRVSASIDVSSIPMLDGCQQLIDSGIESTLAPDNRSVARRVSIVGGDVESKSLAGLFDPQTGGGLLFGIQRDQAGSVIHYLHQNGFVQSAVVGEVTGTSETPELRLG